MSKKSQGALIAFIVLGFFILSTAAARAQSAEELAQEEAGLRPTLDDVIFAHIENDAATLTYLSHRNAEFQSGKRQIVEERLKGYWGDQVRTDSIDVDRILVYDAQTAKVMVKVTQTSWDVDGNQATTYRSEVWNFVKGSEGDEKDRWLLLV